MTSTPNREEIRAAYANARRYITKAFGECSESNDIDACSFLMKLVNARAGAVCGDVAASPQSFSTSTRRRWARSDLDALAARMANIGVTNTTTITDDMIVEVHKDFPDRSLKSVQAKMYEVRGNMRPHLVSTETEDDGNTQ